MYDMCTCMLMKLVSDDSCNGSMSRTIFREHRWSSVCNEECVFNPYVMERFV